MSSALLFELADVSFAYEKELVISHVDLELKPGNFYGIVGPNGSGKTTLLDLLIGSRSPKTGSIRYKGQKIDAYSKKELARNLALVPQEFDTGFGFRVEEIVMMGRHPHLARFEPPQPEDIRQVKKAMSAIGIEEIHERMINTLSGGQKQRAIVARAIAQQTPVILFDEATSNLDIRYTLQIFRLAQEMVRSEERTIIAVMHDLNLAAAYCNHLVLLDKGKIVAQGPTEHVLTAENIYDVFGVETAIEANTFSGTKQISYNYNGQTIANPR